MHSWAAPDLANPKVDTVPAALPIQDPYSPNCPWIHAAGQPGVSHFHAAAIFPFYSVFTQQKD